MAGFFANFSQLATSTTHAVPHLQGRFISLVAYVWLPFGRFKRDFSERGTGKIGEKRLRPGNWWSARISDFIVVSSQSAAKIPFIYFFLYVHFQYLLWIGNTRS